MSQPIRALGAESSSGAQRDAERSLGDVLDQHAQLRDVLAQIREAADERILGGLLRRLEDLLEEHFAREEQAHLLHRPSEAPGADSAAAQDLAGEHRELLTRVRELAGRVASEGGPADGDREELLDLLERIRRHDERETELFRGMVGIERGDRVAESLPSSKALEVNLRRTAVEVVIPAEQLLLLELTADHYGVHEATRKLLREINHPYVGWSQTLDDLHRRATSDLPYYLASERAAGAIAVFCALYARAAEEATPAALRETAIRYQTFYLENVLRQAGERASGLLAVVAHSLARLEDLLRRSPQLGALVSPRIARVVEALLEAAVHGPETAVERGLSLLSLSLRQSYELWLSLEDPAAWWREEAGAGPDAPVPEPVAAISHGRLAECLEALERSNAAAGSARARARALLALPDSARIARGLLDAAACAEAAQQDPAHRRMARIRWLARVLSVEALGAVHEQALLEIGRVHAEVVADADPAAFERFARGLFAALRRSGLLCTPSALRVVSKLGAATLATGDAERARIVVDEMLLCEFPKPGFSGFGDEWQVRSDPAHLAAIRAYLEVIEADPGLAHALIAALVVHLAIGGVLITDMDLFQKDVSQLLNSGVGPAYHTIKHLLKLFPVYFAEIGAEGELRAVSSRIDEIDARRDPLCHFLRKQAHVESSPRLIDCAEAVARFWKTGDPTPLRAYLPATLYERVAGESARRAGPGQVLRELIGDRDASALFDLEPPELARRLEANRAGGPVDREKVGLLFELRRLLGRKYELDHRDLMERLGASPRIGEDELRALRRALDAGHVEKALDRVLAILERLKAVIVSEERTEAIEDIYRKRHIAAGIPSLYGRYREEKLEAVGLGFRAESLANALFERLIASPDLECPTRSTLRRVAGWLRLWLRAVRVDGCQGRGLAAGIAMLERALDAEGTSIDQYVNVFQVLSRSLEQLLRIRLLDVYEPVLDRLLSRMVQRGEIPLEAGASEEETVLKVSERFLRDRVAESLGVQQLDRLLASVLRALQQAREKLDRDGVDRLISFDAERSSLAIDRRASPLDGAVHLGNKGYVIKRLAQEGLPVPPGFLLTTELFRCRPALRASEALRGQVAGRIRRELRRVERRTGARLGDARRPLLLSVRSSSAISMPGMLDTFLNVGIDARLAEGLAARSGSTWGAWDAYRRFLQSWGMAHGLERDLFDALMRDAKTRSGVEKKAQLAPAQMRALALRYREFVEDRGIPLVDEPFEQLLSCVDLVLRSWDADRARVYRSELGIAEQWGMAVIVQSMVYGNLHERSGTGVVLTCDPRRSSQDVRLYGDFAVQAQGDDVVGGLVETLPISEEQRRSGGAGAARSLERDFPEIYRALLRHASHLVRDLGMFHQEIEFTFESEDPADLYILQSRDTVMSKVAAVAAFVPTPALEQAKLASGIGAGGGALAGRVAHTAADVAVLRARFPEDPIILLRPDTVPDDIPLIVQVDGMVTARGGSTSHAALAAQRLGRVCVVGCSELQVDESAGRSTLAGRPLASGDFVSINGLDGSVYAGRHPAALVRRQRLA